jgi:hypothetical protein
LIFKKLLPEASEGSTVGKAQQGTTNLTGPDSDTTLLRDKDAHYYVLMYLGCRVIAETPQGLAAWTWLPTPGFTYILQEMVD